VAYLKPRRPKLFQGAKVSGAGKVQLGKSVASRPVLSPRQVNAILRRKGK
jgi:hypothetical protein